MDKRYQVFVSSTFADLKDERSNVIQTLMEMDCIPAGMELFPALDEEQFEFIKTVIDDSDYYLLIVGGRYGSLSDEGVSYTEMEYDYAISKGIKVIALVHGSAEKLAVEKVEMDSEAQQKLQAFKQKVTTNRLVKFWDDAKELSGLVALSLPKTIKTYPAAGWVRGNEATDNTELLKQLNDLRQENSKLEKQIQVLQANNTEILDLAQGEDILTISIRHNVNRGGKREKVKLEYYISWNEILKFIVPKVLQPYPERAIHANFTNYIASKYPDDFDIVSIDTIDFENIKIQLLALEYIRLLGDPMDIFWEIMPSARKKIVRSLAFKRYESDLTNDE
ncbi:DUF4062 domain-containing protein [Psychrobacter fozii]|uniref:DUF4062 domain-containing protein n=1 Tax=Psychrobacter fozii TaxID=198480 RepID=UPI00191A3EF6|nr:DUF4062 domain-containing protein [Psychrobacter fozii]